MMLHHGNAKLLQGNAAVSQGNTNVLLDNANFIVRQRKTYCEGKQNNVIECKTYCEGTQKKILTMPPEGLYKLQLARTEIDLIIHLDSHACWNKTTMTLSTDGEQTKYDLCKTTGSYKHL